jgi:hypothetical protein
MDETGSGRDHNVFIFATDASGARTTKAWSNVGLSLIDFDGSAAANFSWQHCDFP